MNRFALCTAALTMSLGGQRVGAGTLTVAFDPGTLHVTTAISGFATTGAMMDGMLVSATFADGSMQTVIWADTGADAGGVFGTGWSLTQEGDTFNADADWVLTNTSGQGITSIKIDAAAGNTMFDRSFSGSFGTEGSANGRTFSAVSDIGSLPDILVTYRNYIALTGQAPVGDVFAHLDIDFSGAGFGSGSELRFLADTDNAVFPNDINPIPEPTSLALLGIGGVIGLVGYARRRRKAA